MNPLANARAVIFFAIGGEYMSRSPGAQLSFTNGTTGQKTILYRQLPLQHDITFQVLRDSFRDFFLLHLGRAKQARRLLEIVL
jgi:hypothetical protein